MKISSMHLSWVTKRDTVHPEVHSESCDNIKTKNKTKNQRLAKKKAVFEGRPPHILIGKQVKFS